jgi:fused signal recognition particle receptor
MDALVISRDHSKAFSRATAGRANREGLRIKMLFGKPEKKEGFFSKLKAAVSSTKANLVAKIEDVVMGKKEIDAVLLDELEAILIGADIGVETTSEILDEIRDQVDRKQIQDAAQLKTLIKLKLRRILEITSDVKLILPSGELRVIMVVGVNGVGKTTTIGKLANLFRSEDKKVLICAADTFRAAAIEQLEIWGKRAEVDIIRQKSGADPSAVLFDAIAAGKARGVQVLIIDTAGRLHTKDNLMRELEKMKRIASREIAGAPHEVLLVIDAVTGQNGLNQAREFLKSAGITGIVLTKLDGTAKGGVVVAIARELKVPIQYVGVGEKIDDLLPFSPDQYIDSLFEA